MINDADLRLRAVEMLLAAGANPTLQTEGSDPLFACVLQKDARVLQVLLERGADPNTEDDDDGEPLYDWARFDYFFDEWWYVNGRWEDEWPEEPTDADRANPDAWLDFLDRIAIKYGRRRPDYLRVLRQFGATSSRERLDPA